MASFQPPRSALAVSELTEEYHKSILRLAHEFSASKVAWDVSQHVLDQLWENPLDSATPSNSSGPAMAHACQACGHHLHPGWKGTTLRIKRPKVLSPSAKRTLRRRALRKRKQAARAEAMKAKKHGRPRSNDEKAGDVTVCLLRDDAQISPLDRNHLVLSCGRCGDQTRCKGLRRETRGLKTKSPAKIPGKPVPSSHSEALGNFERLPKLSRKDPSSKNSTNKSTPLQQKLGKKKKKKGSETKKGGNLMNFLSSLNDH